MTDRSRLLQIANEALDVAAEIFQSRRPTTLTDKSDRDFVSDLDFTIERTVRAFLHARAPEIGFLGEEEGAQGIVDGRPYWALDPVDGTSNFVHGIPLCAVALGLVHNKQPELGVVELPFLNCRYAAVAGRGAHLNGTVIRASTTTNLGNSMISIGDYAVGADASRKNDQRIILTRVLAERAERVRMIGSAAIDLVWTAHGKLDGTIILANKPWDTAAGTIIAREAGAIVADADGSPHTVDSLATICATPGIIDEIVGLVEASIGHMHPPAVDVR